MQTLRRKFAYGRATRMLYLRMRASSSGWEKAVSKSNSTVVCCQAAHYQRWMSVTASAYFDIHQYVHRHRFLNQKPSEMPVQLVNSGLLQCRFSNCSIHSSLGHEILTQNDEIDDYVSFCPSIPTRCTEQPQLENEWGRWWLVSFREDLIYGRATGLRLRRM